MSAAAIVLTVVIFVPYIRSIVLGRLKPHVFSWIIWGLGTFIVFFAQLAGNGGVGAWPIGVSACITCVIAVLAYIYRGDTSITRLDWLFLMIALSALPFWFFTADPLWAVVILTLSDLVGFGPTLRKAYSQPYEESILFFSLGALRNTLVVLALEHYSMTTWLFPVVVGIACVVVAIFLYVRRQVVPPAALSAEQQ